MNVLPHSISLFVLTLILASCNDREIQQTYFENGSIKSECQIKNGVRNGLARTFFENGTLKYEGNFKDGSRDGWHVLYYPNSSIHQRILYDKSNGRELAKRKLRYDKRDNLISDISFANKSITYEIRSRKPFRVYDTLSVKLKVEGSKYPYSEATMGDFDQNLNVVSNAEDTPTYYRGNKNHEIFMRVQITKAGLDTLKYMIFDYNLKYAPDSTETAIGEQSFLGIPIEVLPR